MTEVPSLERSIVRVQLTNGWMLLFKTNDGQLNLQLVQGKLLVEMVIPALQAAELRRAIGEILPEVMRG